MRSQPTFFDGQRTSLADALNLTALSLSSFGLNYDHWAIAYSGGKDSSATVTAIVWLIENGFITPPKTLTVLMSDTRMEMPPLFASAMKVLSELEARGVKVRVVMPAMLHWRLCHVWDWLTGCHELKPHGFSTGLIAAVYGQDENLETHARTGCVGCNLASRDFALEEIVKRPYWKQYSPLLELRPLYALLKLPKNRLRKDGTETRKDGSLVANPCRMGPLTFEARLTGLARVKDIQARAGVDLINQEEERRIMELIEARTWPRGWDGTEHLASLAFDNVNPDGSVQPVFTEIL